MFNDNDSSMNGTYNNDIYSIQHKRHKLNSKKVLWQILAFLNNKT